MQHFWRTQIGDLGMRAKLASRLRYGQGRSRDLPRNRQEKRGAWGRIRTTDTRIFNPLLYQLSYPGKRPASRERRL